MGVDRLTFFLVFFIYFQNSFLQETQERKDFIQERKILEETDRIRLFSQEMLPPKITRELESNGGTIAHKKTNVSILVCDIVNFTYITAKMEPIDVVAILNVVFSTFDMITTLLNTYKVDTFGDTYIVCSDVYRGSTHSAIIDTGIAFQTYSQFFYTNDKQKIRFRVGIHTGDVIAGVVGDKMPRYHLFGETVIIAEAIERFSQHGTVVISNFTKHSLNKED